jgi:hypothetical protein
MMIHIPIPEGLKLPENAESEPFTAEVEFLVMDGMLMPVAVAGKPIASEEPEMEEGEYGDESGEMEEDSGEMEGESGEMCSECGGDEKKCRCGKMGKGGGGGEDSGGFMVAIERALAQPKR